MELRQRRRELDGDLQRELEVRCARGEQRLQRDFASVLENQACNPILPFQGVDADDPGKSEVARDRRLALEQLRVEGTRRMRRRQLEEHRLPIGPAAGTADDRPLVAANLFENLVVAECHGR